MVANSVDIKRCSDIVSVLALSSRFDGQRECTVIVEVFDCFSTRSVESF